MTEPLKRNRSTEKALVICLASFAVLLGIMIIFGYSVGKDLAMRENAREAAVADRQRK